MTREPAGKAQLTAAVIAMVTYLIQKWFQLLPEEMDLAAPIIAYAVAQVIGWWWSRQQTTPVASPRLDPGTPVRLPDGTTGTVSRR